ncbi:MAG TPA: 1-acyl-sn-glycerol-3-phosphate acyltransferase [Kofleriaceae bacterium]|jgi:1-acyl-sn-glycerol-3-phosphate acyltransferase
MIREALISTFRQLIRLYFRDIERLGISPGADTRGRVFVANHTNALIDPVVVMTDTKANISPVAKSTLWNVPGLNWLLNKAGAVPIVRRSDAPDKAAGSNSDVFDKIASHLGGGGNILIFPEGTSHSEPTLAPLRTGAARMMAAAAAREEILPTFQAVALEFDDRTDFRSRALIVWGPVRQFADVPGEGEDKIANATAQMKQDLEDLLVDAETHEDRLRIARVAEMFANDAGDQSLGAWSEAGRRVELAQKTLRNAEPRLIAQITELVDAYYAEVDRLGVDDAQVLGLPAPSRPEEPLWKRAALAPLAASGFALYAIPYFLPRFLARNADADAVSTFKLGAALVVYPLWAAGLVTGSFMLLPPPLSVVGAAVAVTSPFAALRWMDDIYQRRPELSGEDRARLARLRISAKTALEEARARIENLA